MEAAGPAVQGMPTLDPGPVKRSVEPLNMIEKLEQLIQLQSRYVTLYQQWSLQLLVENERLRKRIDAIKQVSQCKEKRDQLPSRFVS